MISSNSATKVKTIKQSCQIIKTDVLIRCSRQYFSYQLILLYHNLINFISKVGKIKELVTEMILLL